MAHIPNQCDGCGAVDADPKLHYGDETYHHDCAPFRVLNDLPEDVQAFVKRAVATGLKGDELRAHIDSLHKDA